ncbi:hypothetical protein [Solimonas marina]|uniref:Tetratricopeptide repeat protein n=1 Tax=Solimonas marina TaxID=2714601 RepID=A0A969W6Y5_9GAMM|nr:hypothetical protein [Solimonas marina]NKF21737.1 hypothetical protein [Solimonas marina]
MHRLTQVLCLLAPLLVLPPAYASFTLANDHPPQPEAVSAARDALRAAAKQLQDDHVDGAYQQAVTAIEAPGFSGLSGDEKHAAWALAGYAALTLKKMNEARRYLDEATIMPQASAFDWTTRLQRSYATADYRDSAICVAAIAQRWPQELAQINSRAILQIERKLHAQANAVPQAATDADADAGSDADSGVTDVQLRMLGALFDAHWRLEEGQPDFLWMDLALLRLARGDIDGASAAALRVESGDNVLSMVVDRRFDPIVTAHPQSFDVAKAAAAGIALAQKRVAEDPDSLAKLSELQQRLLRMRRFDDVLASSDAVIQRVAQGGEKAYRDADLHYTWILDGRARALWGLGRWNASIEQLRAAAQRPEVGGGANVSQAINLGHALALLGQPDAALQAIAKLGGTSPFGRMQANAVRVLAAVLRHDPTTVERTLAEMREHRDDAMSTYEFALVQAGRLDDAAQLLRERLADARWRSDALTDVQIYARVPQPPLAAEYERRWRSVVARPDVQQALNAVGRIASPVLGPPPW